MTKTASVEAIRKRKKKAGSLKDLRARNRLAMKKWRAGRR